MSRITEVGLRERVEPLPHPDIKRGHLLLAYSSGIFLLENQASRNQTDLSIKTDSIALKRILGPFWAGGGKASIHHALTDSRKIPRGDLWIPVAMEGRLGAPVAPIQRAYDREADTILRKESPTEKELADVQELRWLSNVFKTYRTQPLIAEGDPTWQWMTEEVAYELYAHARGKDALDDWNRAKALTSEPILLVP